MYKNIFFIRKEQNSSYRIFSMNESENQKLISQDDLKQRLISFKEHDLIIHDMPSTIYNKKMVTLGEFVHINDAFGCSFNAYFTQFSFNELVLSNIKSFENYEIPQLSNTKNKHYNFYNELLVSHEKVFFFGGSNDYVEYTINFEQFYNFLKVQNFPDEKSLNEVSFDIPYMSDQNMAKLAFTLGVYEGFAVCELLISDDILLDGLSIFENKSNIIIPFNLLKYLNKYKNIIDISIKKIYITKKKKLQFDDSISPIEKAAVIGSLSERGDLLIRMYVRYYFLIYILKHFQDDVISLNMRNKIFYTYSKGIKTKLFQVTKDFK